MSKLTPLEQSQLLNQQYRDLLETQKEIIKTLMEMNELKVLPPIISTPTNIELDAEEDKR